MEYETIYRPYNIPTLIKWVKSNRKGTTYQESRPLKDWNTALNKYTKQGYEIVNSGTIVSGDNAIFWALMKKPENKEPEKPKGKGFATG